MLGWKSMALNAYIRKQEMSKISYLGFQLERLQKKKKKVKSEVDKRREVMKISVKINQE